MEGFSSKGEQLRKLEFRFSNRPDRYSRSGSDDLKSDEIWSVHVEELHLDDPVEVIGQGSFGVVLLAGMWEKKAGCRSNSSVADALILFPLQM